MDIREYTDIIAEETLALLSQIDSNSVSHLFDLIRRCNTSTRIFCGAFGRSGYILRCFCMRLMHLGYQTCFVGDTTTPPIGKGDVFIVLSGSGQTPWTRNWVDRAKEAQASVFGIIGHDDSPVAQAVDDCILLTAGSKTESPSDRRFSDQPLGSLFEQTAFVLLESIVLALYRSQENHRQSLGDRHANLE